MTMRDVRFRKRRIQSRRAAFVKSFGRRTGVRKSPRNEAAGRKGGLWGFRFKACVARRSARSAGRDADKAHCRSIERFAGCRERLGYAMLAPLTSFGTRDDYPKRMRFGA
jgi:hypothetical protein